LQRNNRIRSIPASINTVTHLKQANLANNYISEIEQNLTLQYLRLLDLASNNISDFETVRRLETLPNLRNLDLSSNPVSGLSLTTAILPGFLPPVPNDELRRLSVVFTLSKLKDLDKSPVTVSEKKRALEIFNPSENYKHLLRNTESKLQLLSRPARYLDLERRWYEATPPLLLGKLSLDSPGF
jgi:Leucine-rich repeat (LRR) protein